jgi:transposase
VNRYFDAVRNSLSAPDQLILDGVEESDTTIVVRVRARQPSPCPACGDARVSYHSRYERRLRDLPWQGRQVRVHLQTRRFRCRNTECGRKVFAEQVPDVAAPWARETGRLHEVIAIVGYAMGGLPGARLLNRLGMPVSDDTVLRRIKTRPSAAVPTVRVLGVDDWAWRKGLR